MSSLNTTTPSSSDEDDEIFASMRRAYRDRKELLRNIQSAQEENASLNLRLDESMIKLQQFKESKTLEVTELQRLIEMQTSIIEARDLELAAMRAKTASLKKDNAALSVTVLKNGSEFSRLEKELKLKEEEKASVAQTCIEQLESLRQELLRSSQRNQELQQELQETTEGKEEQQHQMHCLQIESKQQKSRIIVLETTLQETKDAAASELADLKIMLDMSTNRIRELNQRQSVSVKASPKAEDTNTLPQQDQPDEDKRDLKKELRDCHRTIRENTARSDAMVKDLADKGLEITRLMDRLKAAKRGFHALGVRLLKQQRVNNSLERQIQFITAQAQARESKDEQHNHDPSTTLVQKRSHHALIDSNEGNEYVVCVRPAKCQRVSTREQSVGQRKTAPEQEHRETEKAADATIESSEFEAFPQAGEPRLYPKEQELARTTRQCELLTW